MTAPKSQEPNYGIYQESRIVRVESTIDNVNQTLLRLENNMNLNFQSLNDRVEKVELNLNDRIDKLEINLNEKIEKLESKVDKGFEEFDQRFTKLETKIDNRIWSNFYWTIGAISGLFFLIAHGLHWL